MNIRVDLETAIFDGTEVVFRSPVDCSQITGLIVYYPVNGNTTSKEFAFADAHGNNVGDVDHLFTENVVVKVILDVTTSMAFVQNADTNAYLERRFDDVEASVEELREQVDYLNSRTESLQEIFKTTTDITSRLKDNEYMFINQKNNGEVQTTASAICVSNPIPCKWGDTLAYKLSCDKNNPIVATYDKDMNLVATIMADEGGRKTYVEGEYEFTDKEAYFRISGIITDIYFENYTVSHKSTASCLIAREGDEWEV